MSKRWMMATVTAVLLLAAACGGGDSPQATDGQSGSTAAPDGSSSTVDPGSGGLADEASTTSVDVVDLDFEPAEVEVAVGETITWQNTGDLAHTVTSQSAGFDSGSLESGDEFTFTPEEPGTISYSCQFHSSMQGTIVVTG